MKKQIAASLTTVALILGTAGMANAAPAGSPAPSHDASHTVTIAPYTDADVVEFLVFGHGKLARDVPSLRGFVVDLEDQVDGDLVSEVVATYLAAYPTFTTDVTQRLQSGDPFETAEALESFKKASAAAALAVGIPQSELDLGDASGKCAVWVAVAVAVAGAVAATVAGAVNVTAVVNISYFWTRGADTAGPSSSLTDQQFSAEVATHFAR